MPEPIEGAVQPDVGAQPTDAGQGQSTETAGLYPDLSSLSESVRDQVNPVLKEWEGNVTRRFQEAAEYRKQWEPYSELGIHEIPPDEVQELLAFRELAQDPEQFADWHRQVGEQLGFGRGDEPPTETDAGAFDPKQVADLIAQQLDERLGPIQSAYQRQEEERAMQEAEKSVSGALDELQTQHGEFDRDAVCQLAGVYADGKTDVKDILAKGFADYQRLVGQVEKGVFQAKADQPTTPEVGGRPATAAEPITTFDQAKEAARAILQGARS